MKKAISLLLLSLCLSVLHARDINFSQISSKNGLSQNTVRAIAEDKNGFIWAGTLDGLNRYDGYNIRSYQLRTGDQHILHDHRIRNLYATRDGNLWVQTYQQEYSCYNPISDQFVHIMANCLLMKISMNPPVVMYGCGEKELGQFVCTKKKMEILISRVIYRQRMPVIFC